MATLKEQSFHSRKYAVLYSTQTGTWIVERRSDGATSLREVCSAGWQQYRWLKSLWRKSRKRFNAEVEAEYEFYKEGEYGN